MSVEAGDDAGGRVEVRAGWEAATLDEELR
jgi:hypothetical protein